jgi:hypothetical protein
MVAGGGLLRCHVGLFWQLFRVIGQRGPASLKLTISYVRFTMLRPGSFDSVPLFRRTQRPGILGLEEKPPVTANSTTQYPGVNRAKASFDDIYEAPTPHAYLSQMRRLGYQIGAQARPYCVAAAELVASEAPTWPVQMLDVGCSYGVGSAFIQYGCSFEELVSFYESRAPVGYHECVAATRAWLNVIAPPIDMRVVGLDASENAIRFALDAGLLNMGISRDLETDDLNAEEQEWLGGCNILISTGAIGYVGKPTFRRVLKHLGRSHPSPLGPLAVMTVLRMFDLTEVREAFEEAGFAFERIPDVRLPQRAFNDEREREEVIDAVLARGYSTDGLEECGVLYADLYIASRKETQPRLRAAIERVKPEAPLFSRQVQVAHVHSSTSTHTGSQ